MALQSVAPSPVAGTSAVSAVLSMTIRSRSLYLYENDGIQSLSVLARGLYAYENDGVQALSVLARGLYAYENDGVQAQSVLARDLYGYEATRDLPVQPWLETIEPTQQYPGGAVDLYGDGLGSLAEAAAAATITASSTSGTNLPGNVAVRTSATACWQSNEASPWLRIAFSGGAKTVYAIALEDLPGASANVWGVPLFRFSDGGADVTGATAVPIPQASDRSAEYPVGTVRTLYVLPAERPGNTWVEVRVASGGAGTARGLSQVWAYADEGAAAEGSQALLNALAMGAVAWSNRSPGLWPANGGVPQSAAATVTVPLAGASGLVTVTES